MVRGILNMAIVRLKSQACRGCLYLGNIDTDTQGTEYRVLDTGDASWGFGVWSVDDCAEATLRTWNLAHSDKLSANIHIADIATF